MRTAARPSGVCGHGVLGAATLARRDRPVSRFRSTAAFARFNGTAPIRVWSGDTARVRTRRQPARRLTPCTRSLSLGFAGTAVDKLTAAGRPAPRFSQSLPAWRSTHCSPANIGRPNALGPLRRRRPDLLGIEIKEHQGNGSVEMRYRLIEGAGTPWRLPVGPVLGVSRQDHCAWKRRGRGSPTPRWIETITKIHQNSRGTSGAPRIHAELREDQACGWPGGAAVGCHQRRRIELTRRDPTAGPALDLAQRNFHAVGPDRLWIADLIHVPMSWLVPDGGAGRVLPWARRVRSFARRARRRR